MVKRDSIILLACLVLVTASCGGNTAPVTPAGAPKSASTGSAPLPSQSATAPTQPAAPPAALTDGRDLSAIHVCEIVTSAEVADMAGGKVDQEALQSNTETGAVCVYHVGFPDGDYQQYRVNFQPPNLVGPLVECCAADLGQPVEGFGDVAYLKRDADAGSLTLLALVRNDFALELSATAAGETEVKEEAVRHLANALLGRVLQR